MKALRAVPVFYPGLVLACFLASCDDGGGGSPPSSSSSSSSSASLPEPLSRRYPIDGDIDFSHMEVREVQVDLMQSLGTGSSAGVSALRWSVLNDDRDLYIALEWTDDDYNHDFDISSGPVDFDGVKLLFDVDGNGAYEADEDARIVIAASVSSQYIDQHKESPDETDVIGNGFGRLKRDEDAGLYTAEFLFPFSDDAEKQDGVLTAGTRFNILIYDHVELAGPTGNAGSAYGPVATPDDATQWPALPLVDASEHRHPELPENLTGLIVFISDHEVAKGEVYGFDPATGMVEQITDDPTLYKENVSLSHDRTQVAFHAAPDRTDFNGYEIYKADIETGAIEQLTDDLDLDGHPAWSPDDSRLAYASFEGLDGEANIVVMDDEGNEIMNLTPPGADDNDPEYLPSGRIVFKTDRFSAQPEVRLAVMDADGSNVELLTDIDGVSDHDPVGDEAAVIFERFNKNTDYSTDVEAVFVGWDLIEVDLATLAERRLLADGWINWLPVYDPTGEYIVYLKSVGYTGAFLMTRGGQELGQLIPDITRIRYIDWK